MNLRPAWASSIRRSTCVPKYGAGLGRSTVACISCNSSVGARVERFSPVASVVDNMVASFSWVRPNSARTPTNDSSLQLGDLVEELIDRRTDFLEPFRLCDGEVGRSDIPGVGRDLGTCDEVLR